MVSFSKFLEKEENLSEQTCSRLVFRLSLKLCLEFLIKRLSLTINSSGFLKKYNSFHSCILRNPVFPKYLRKTLPSLKI